LFLIMAVLVAALLDPAAVVIAAACGFASLNYFFTPPVDQFTVPRGDDLVALATFVVAAAVLGWVVTVLAALRRKAETREREVGIRLDLTTRLIGGEPPDRVAAGAAEALLELFGFTRCTLAMGSMVVTATQPGEPGELFDIVAGDLRLEAIAPRGGLSTADRAVVEALVTGLGAALDRLRLEVEAREARVAAQVGQTRSGFLSAVTHNLRTPLASIRAASSTLRSPEAHLDDDDRRELLDTIYDETDRLARLVTKILDLSRIRAGGLEVRAQPTDIGDLAQNAVRRLRPIVRDHRVRLAADDVPPVMVDVAMIEQVFTNLLENALRFAPSGSEILVSLDKRDGAVEVRVADHGVGIAPVDRERVFEEFVRVASRDDTSGTGLGLAIVRALVSAHGGRAWYEETPGGGATFAFSLPDDGCPA
jgi:two-component system sensor histidine kinase KdpD